MLGTPELEQRVLNNQSLIDAKKEVVMQDKALKAVSLLPTTDRPPVNRPTSVSSSLTHIVRLHCKETPTKKTGATKRADPIQSKPIAEAMGNRKYNLSNPKHFDERI